MTAAFVFHPGAEAEPREIVRYMRREWGEKQARAYAAKLRRRIQARASGTKACKDMSALYPGVRMVRCEHHYIFCVPQHDIVHIWAVYLKRFESCKTPRG